METKEMTLKEFLSHLDSGKEVEAGSPVHQYMHKASQEARAVTCRLNSTCGSPDKVRDMFEELIGKPVDESFALFPPFYTDCGKNIHVEKNVFINAGCHFQDQGGIRIGEGTLIGHNAIFATLNHREDPARRHNMLPKPITIGSRVWIGAGVTVVPGVTIGDNAIVAAGAVVTKNVEKNTVVAGIPARKIKTL